LIEHSAIEITPEMIEVATQILWKSGFVEYEADGPMQLVVRDMFDAAFKMQSAGKNHESLHQELPNHGPK